MSAERKTSRAIIRPADVNQRFIYILDSTNPEIVLANELGDFLKTIGYSEMFPNFDAIRVGTTHPFAILLAQEVLGQQQKVDVFPSITVADSNAQEDAEVLSDDNAVFVFTADEIAKFDGLRQAKEVYVSDSGWEKIQTKIQETGHIIGVRRLYHTQHSIDFNIWSEHKQITSFLFDMVAHFVSQKRVDLHESYGIDMDRISGRRTGDLNLDFGRLLYGANMTVTTSMGHEAVLMDTAVDKISEIDTTTMPQYFALKSVTGGDIGG